MLKKINFARTLYFCLLILILSLFLYLAAPSLFQAPSLAVEWSTESELDIIGFNILRADSADGEFDKINDELIPPAPDPFVGGDHTFVDENVTRGQTYYYQLETVDRNGNTTRSEVIELRAGG